MTLQSRVVFRTAHAAGLLRGRLKDRQAHLLTDVYKRQKLGLAQAIMEGQDILVLDEPFNALDYKTYNDVKEISRTLHAEVKTILMSSHNYEDIETLCDEIYAIEDGQLGTLPADEMKRRFRG